MRWANTVETLGFAVVRHPSPITGLIAPILSDVVYAPLLGVAVIGVVREARRQPPRRPWAMVARVFWIAAAAHLTLTPGDAGRLDLVLFSFGPSATP